MGNVFEIVGKVNQDLSVKVLKATDLGKDGEFLSFALFWGVDDLDRGWGRRGILFGMKDLLT